MGTTVVIVELLVIGFQVLAWVGLLVGLEWVACCELGNWIPVVGVLLLAAAYTVGIVFDRFLGVCSWVVMDWDCKLIKPLRKPLIKPVWKLLIKPLWKLLIKPVWKLVIKPLWKLVIKPLRRKLRALLKHPDADEKTITDMRLDIMLWRPDAHRHLESRERQGRLLRATGPNALLFGLACWIRGAVPRPVPCAVVIAVIVVGLLAFCGWFKFKRDLNSVLTYYLDERAK